MSKRKYSDVCEHKNQVLDEHEGTYVCTNCAKVIDNFYIQSFQTYDNEVIFKEKNTSNLISSEFASRLNIPVLNIDDKKNELKSASNIYLEANKADYSVTLKEISAISGYSVKQIGKETKNTVNLLNIDSLLEKYCKLLDLNYKTYSVIKETINTANISGHNPLTIVASHIYKFLKDNKKKISMKKICEVIGISSISIQRYLKTLQ